jgi:predicted MFS family arabinose efflux permease
MVLPEGARRNFERRFAAPGLSVGAARALPPVMSFRQLKTGYFALTALNTLATTYFFNYLFFYLRDHFGFGNRQNLWLSALYGFIYIFSAWQCGRFAERRGYLVSLKIGFAGLTAVVVAGALLDSKIAIVCVIMAYSVALLFTWPALEALVSEHESRAGVQDMVGVYNCTWSAASAFAYFTGGTLYGWLGRGAIFWLPAAIFFGQLLLVLWLERRSQTVPIPAAAGPAVPQPEAVAFHQPVSPQGFLKLAWLANPFSFVAVNTLWAVMPGVAAKLALTPAQVGVFCSVWLFARFAAFALCWRWTGWHYRFRWLFAAYVALAGGFVLMTLAPHLWLVVLAQIFFGLAAGLIYYSSLFYSMDAGDTKGEHGGLHEAAIGAGTFAGPAVGAASLQFLPQFNNGGVLAVSGLLVVGLAALLAIWRSQKRDVRS